MQKRICQPARLPRQLTSSATSGYYNSDIGLFYGQDIIKGNTLEPVTMHPYLVCWNSLLYFVDLDGEDLGKWRTGVEGVEAHLVLEGYFMAHYVLIPLQMGIQTPCRYLS